MRQPAYGTAAPSGSNLCHHPSHGQTECIQSCTPRTCPSARVCLGVRPPRMDSSVVCVAPQCWKGRASAAGKLSSSVGSSRRSRPAAPTTDANQHATAESRQQEAGGHAPCRRRRVPSAPASLPAHTSRRCQTAPAGKGEKYCNVAQLRLPVNMCCSSMSRWVQQPQGNVKQHGMIVHAVVTEHS